MNIFRKSFLIIVLLLTGCTPVNLVMKVDTALQANAIVYELHYPDSFSDTVSGRKLNISFGPYRVTDADVGLAKLNTQAEDPGHLIDIKRVRRSKNTTVTTSIEGGPTSILGFTRPAAVGEPSIHKISQSIKYKFKAGRDIIWNALCSHRARKRVTEHEDRTDVEMLSSNFTCLYTEEDKGADSETWTLSVEYGGAITMTQKGRPDTLTAHSTGGNYVKPDGRTTTASTRYAGYTWQQSKGGSNKNIAAISIKEKKPRVWLDKGNSDALNHVLSMASTGLLIYSWEIQR